MSFNLYLFELRHRKQNNTHQFHLGIKKKKLYLFKENSCICLFSYTKSVRKQTKPPQKMLKINEEVYPRPQAWNSLNMPILLTQTSLNTCSMNIWWHWNAALKLSSQTQRPNRKPSANVQAWWNPSLPQPNHLPDSSPVFVIPCRSAPLLCYFSPFPSSVFLLHLWGADCWEAAFPWQQGRQLRGETEV